MENKKTYTRERPESWKWFSAPYEYIVFGLCFFLGIGFHWFTLNVFTFHSDFVEYLVTDLIPSLLCGLPCLLYVAKHFKVRHEFAKQFIEEEKISLEKYNVTMKSQGKQVIFSVIPRDEKENLSSRKG